VKIDDNGGKQWDKTYGGTAEDKLDALEVTSDGGFIVGGYYYEYGGAGTKTGDHSDYVEGGHDYWVLKLSSTGTLEWDQNYGGSSGELCHSVWQTSDGGYVIGGYSGSGISGDKTQANKGGIDAWILKTDAAGDVLWDQSYGHTGHDNCHEVMETSDGGFILITRSTSDAGTDKSEDHKGSGDWWVIKTNSTGGITWDKTLGGEGSESPRQVVETTAGDFIIGGWSRTQFLGNRTATSFGGDDFWIVKLKSTGTIDWDIAYGGSGHDRLYGMMPISDGLFISGQSQSNASGSKTQASQGGWDHWTLKLLDCDIAGACGTIWGNAYLDFDEQCDVDPGDDHALPKRLIKIKNPAGDSRYGITDGSGYYEFDEVPGLTYEVSIQHELSSSCVGDETNPYLIALGTGLHGPYPMTHPPPSVGCFPELDIDNGEANPCRCGKFTYCITLENGGTEKILLTDAANLISIQLPCELKYIGGLTPTTIPAPTQTYPLLCTTMACPSPGFPATDFGPLLTWGALTGLSSPDDVLKSLGTFTICFEVEVGYDVSPTASMITSVDWDAFCIKSSTVQSAPQALDTVDLDCPKDPNDKQVSPVGCGPNGNIAPTQKLTYTVRFQNIGTAAATDVLIKDILDQDLDESTFALISSSDPVTSLSINTSREVRIEFDGINLPIASVDEAGSQGYVKFSMLPKPGLSDFTEITNEVRIYFDYEDAVTTNTVKNTIMASPNPPVVTFDANRDCSSPGVMKWDFDYTGGETGVTFAWDFGVDAAPATSALEDPTGIVYSSAGSKTISLTVDRNGCTDTYIDMINVVNDNALVNAWDFHRVCPAPSQMIYDFDYTGGETGVTFDWNFGASATPATSTLEDVTGVTYSMAGSKTVTLTISRNGCVEIETNLIQVDGDPNVQEAYVLFAMYGNTDFSSGNVASSGAIGINTNGYQMTIHTGALVNASEAWVASDMLTINSGGVVNDVYANSVTNNGTINGSSYSYGSPLLTLRSAPGTSPGGPSFNISTSMTLAAGDYGNVTIGSGVPVYFSGGNYEFDNLTLMDDAAIMYQAACLVSVGGTIVLSSECIIKPDNGTVSADDMVMFAVANIAIGSATWIEANIDCRTALLSVGSANTLKGAFLGANVTVGTANSWSLESACWQDITYKASIFDKAMEEERENLQQQFTVFPNPFQDQVTLNYTVIEEAEVTVVRVNSLGQETVIVARQAHISGDYTISEDSRSLPNGIYIYSITIGDRKVARKMIKLTR